MKRFLCILLFSFLLLTMTACDYEEILKTILSDIESIEDSNTTVQGHQEDDIVLTDANFEMHFLELGNEYTGDSTYIKAGDFDILIDAGSRASSVDAIKTQIDPYITDGKLEFVIATHAHQDHIAAFVGKKVNNEYNGILNSYEIDTIIDFDYSNSTSSVYNNYLTIRDTLVEKGTTHYTAGQCFNETDGAKRVFDLGDNMTLEIIYNKYYFETSTDENNYSVCTMLNVGSMHFFLTGDLEKEGEEGIAEYYDKTTKDKTLPEVDLFKAGHHGSKTSSNDCLLSLIKPKMCTVCCCAGSTEYTDARENTFPTQTFIDRISKYTEYIYVTSYYDEDEDTFKSLNGTIVVKIKDGQVIVDCSNNNTILKDSEWFSHTVYIDDNDNIVAKDTENAKGVPCRVWR